jgi:hypothetical protein
MAQIKYLDSRRIMGASTDTVQAPTFETDFSSSTGWTQTGTDVSVDSSTNYRLDFNIPNTANETDALTYDLTNISDSAWVLRFKFVMDNYSQNTTGHAKKMCIGLSSADDSTSIDSTQDAIGILFGSWDNGTHKIRSRSSDGGSWQGGSGTDFTESFTDDEVYYVEIKRTSTTSYTVSLYSDSTYSTLIEAETETIASTVSGLRYFKVGIDTTTTAPDGTFAGYIDDLSIWNGISSITNKPNASLSLSGCKAYYNFEQTSGSLTNIATTANGFDDGLGSSADGTNNGATTGSTGKVGSYAWSFDGSNDYVTVGNTNTFTYINNPNQVSTVAFWYKSGTSPTSTFDTILGTVDGSASARGFEIIRYQSSGAGIIELTEAGGNKALNDYITNTGLFPVDNTWYHYVFVFDNANSQLKIYKNNSLFQTISYSSWTPSTDSATQHQLNIARDIANSKYANLQLDEVVFFNKGLTTSEISTLYNSGTGVAVNDSSITAKPETNSIFIETDTANRWWFDGTDWRQSLIYNQQVVDNSYTFVQASAGNGRRAGIKVASGSGAIGKSVRYIRFKIVRTGSPGGTLYCRVRNSSDTIIAETSENANDVSTSIHEHDFDLGSYVVLSEGDRIMLELYTGSSGNGIWMRDLTSNTMPSDFEKTVYNYSSVYVDSTTTTVWGVINYTDL